MSTRGIFTSRLSPRRTEADICVRLTLIRWKARQVASVKWNCDEKKKFLCQKVNDKMSKFSGDVQDSVETFCFDVFTFNLSGSRIFFVGSKVEMTNWETRRKLNLFLLSWNPLLWYLFVSQKEGENFYNFPAKICFDFLKSLPSKSLIFW